MVDIKYSNLKDYTLIKEIGKGAFSKVYLAIHNDNKKQFALKITDKKYLIKEKRLHHFYIERDLLISIDHPLIAKVYSGFESEDKLITIMEYYKNGDLFDFIKANKPLNLDVIKHLTAQIVCALTFLREKGISHRDLKPENILLDEKMFIKIADFATAKQEGKRFNMDKLQYESGTSEVEDDEDENKDKDRIITRDTFCGTAEYVSPEMLVGRYASFTADYWALGCIIFHLFVGMSPFKHKSPYIVFENIRKLNIQFPNDMNTDAKDLISKLLVHKEKQRLGYNSISEISNHRFFYTEHGINLIDTIFKYKFPMRNSFMTNIDQEEIKEDSISQKIKKIKIIKDSIVEKKSPYFYYNTRRLTLDNTPKINYIDPSTNTTKGTIYLSTLCEARLIDSKSFKLITPKRTFTFKADSPLEWCKEINDQINPK